ncbi:MAG: LapA family protein [Rubrivivax sp.]|nr:LapA family protein [Rubrivivax sp.]
MRVISWLLRAFIFFALFAFALNNQQPVELRWFFGLEWHTRMVFVVLAAFAAGCALGVLAMLPSWWRRGARASQPASTAASSAPGHTIPALPSDFVPESRLREGL